MHSFANECKLGNLWIQSLSSITMAWIESVPFWKRCGEVYHYVEVGAIYIEVSVLFFKLTHISLNAWLNFLYLWISSKWKHIVFIYFFFQFYWYTVDTQHCISLRCTAQELDFHIYWEMIANIYLVNISSPHIHTQKNGFSLWWEILGFILLATFKSIREQG